MADKDRAYCCSLAFVRLRGWIRHATPGRKRDRVTPPAWLSHLDSANDLGGDDSCLLLAVPCGLSRTRSQARVHETIL